MNINHDLARWVFVLVGMAGLIAINVPWRRLRRTSKPRDKSRAIGGRTVLFKHRASEVWRNRNDELVELGQKIIGRKLSGKDARLSWQSQVVECLENILEEPEEFIRTFREKTSAIGTMWGDEAVRRGCQYLKDIRDRITEHHIRTGP